MIYQLPTQGRINRPYRGKYPKRIASVSYLLRSCIHVELNDGRRYVMTRDELDPAAMRVSSWMGWELIDVLKYVAITPPVMALADYAAVVLMSRLVRGIRYQARRIDLVTGNMERR